VVPFLSVASVPSFLSVKTEGPSARLENVLHTRICVRILRLDMSFETFIKAKTKCRHYAFARFTVEQATKKTKKIRGEFSRF
jgi:hypothetical protein